MATNIYIYGISLVVFLAVIVFVEGAFLLWRGVHEEGAIKINRRLKAISAGGGHGKEVLDVLRRKEMSSIPALNRLLAAIPRVHALDRGLEQAGVTLSVSRYLGLMILLIWALALVLWQGLHFHGLTATLMAIPLGIALPTLYVARARAARLQAMAAQLPDALDYIARSLRAGNPFSASLRLVAHELPDPLGTEFGITFDEMNYGLETEDALHNLGHRTGCPEMHFFITAVLIQRQTGGNLATVLNRIAAVMRARAATARDVSILSAEMRLSAYVLIALPFVVAGAVSILNPEYLSPLFDNVIGQAVVLTQLILIAIGYLIMRRMIHFRI